MKKIEKKFLFKSFFENITPSSKTRMKVMYKVCAYINSWP